MMGTVGAFTVSIANFRLMIMTRDIVQVGKRFIWGILSVGGSSYASECLSMNDCIVNISSLCLQKRVYLVNLKFKRKMIR
jgi:hypothetical protein